MHNYRLAVFADIHGNIPALEAVLKDLARRGPMDGYLVAGDMIGGPGQQAVLERLVALGAVMIQGNGEQRVAQMDAGTAPARFYAARQAASTRWFYQHLTPDQLKLICSLPEQRTFHLPGAEMIRIVHGSPRRVNELVLPEANFHPNHFYEPVLLHEVIELFPEPVMICGHTHLPWYAHVDGKLALNPGAVNFPEDGYLGAQYAILIWQGAGWHPELFRIPYDLNQIRRDFETSGFLDTGPYARAVLCSLFTGKDELPPWFEHTQQVAMRQGLAPQSVYDRVFPDEVWEEAARTYQWPEI